MVPQIKQLLKIMSYVECLRLTSHFGNYVVTSLRTTLCSVRDGDEFSQSIKDKINKLFNNKSKNRVISKFCIEIVKFREIEIKEQIYYKDSDPLGAALSDAIGKFIIQNLSNVSIDSSRVKASTNQNLNKLSQDINHSSSSWTLIARESIENFLKHLEQTDVNINDNLLAQTLASKSVPRWTHSVRRIMTTDFSFVAEDKGFNLEISSILASMSGLTYSPEGLLKSVLKLRTSLESKIIKAGYSPESNDLRALIISDQNKLIIAFRGSDNALNWINNSCIIPTTLNIWGKSIDVHSGFENAVKQLWSEISEKILQYQNRLIYVTGHSLGVAMAAITYLYIKNNIPGVQKVAIYTYGQPKWLSINSIENAETLFNDNYHRIVNPEDVVTLLDGYEFLGKGLVYCYVGIEYDVNGAELSLSPPNIYNKSISSVILGYLPKARLLSLENIVEVAIQDHSMNGYIQKLRSFYKNSSTGDNKIKFQPKHNGEMIKKIKPIQGDGNCFYNAVADQLKRLNIRNNEYLDYNNQDLRKAAIDYINDHEIYKNDLIERLRGTDDLGGDLERTASNIEQYIEHHREDGAWTDEGMAGALLKYLDV